MGVFAKETKLRKWEGEMGRNMEREEMVMLWEE